MGRARKQGNIILFWGSLYTKKFKNIMSQKLRTQVVELLILSKMDYADAVFRPLSFKLQKRLQKVENAAASFVLGRYTKEKDVVSLGWLPMKERRVSTTNCNFNRL